MIKVKNNKLINKIAFRNFKERKGRNQVTILAIILTSILFTTIFTLALGTMETFQNVMMQEVGGLGHAGIKYITEDVFNEIKDHPLIKEIAENWILAEDIENPELKKRRTELWYHDESGIKQGFETPIGGHIPVEVDELLADTTSLKLLNVPLEEGAPITLDLVVHGKRVQRTFKLSGWYEASPVAHAGILLTSRAYVDCYEEELKSTYKDDYCATGTIQASILFENTRNLDKKLEQVIIESGYSNIETDENYLPSNVSWAYLSTYGNADPTTIMMVVGVLILITFTGYLIIYNVFQLSVVQDIQFYGLLKTIGTTGKQIKRIILKEAILLGVIGIPIGLVFGFLLGKVLVPYIIRMTNYEGVEVIVSPSPWIFIGAAAFALLTIWLSTHKPGKTAAKVSPIEAMKFTDGTVNYKKMKHTKSGGKVHKMAFANLGRNKKQTLIVMLSMALSLVLFNVVYAFSNSLDMEKYISKRMETDYMIAHNDFFRSSFNAEEAVTSETLIEAVTQLEGFEEGSRIYNNLHKDNITITDLNNTEQDYNYNEYGDYLVQLLGLEDMVLRNAVWLDRNIEYEAFQSGKYIIEGIGLDDNGRPMIEEAQYRVGDQVELHYYKTNENGTKEYMTRTFIVAGHMEIHHYSNYSGIGIGPYNFYLPSNVYAEIVEEPVVMNYLFNVKDEAKEEVENFLRNYTEQTEITMNYASREKYEKELEGTRNTIVLVGGAITLIIALVGILNFINANLTGILSRCKEFAMLQSIGMTGRQLKLMLMYEGIYYTVGTLLISLGLGILSMVTIVKVACNLMAFFTYHFMIWPIFIVAPLLLIIGMILPIVCYRYLNRRSIVERLRQE